MTVLPNLPQLADEEVEALFGADTDGARRYRLLHAVLVRGATQREAASEAGVSERTVRNVLRAYARSGSLETLRSRAPGLHRRRSRRTAAYEQALSDALAEEPLAGGDRLWRRAQELLGPEGGQLSRRTAYRLLAQLRARARKSAPPGLASAVRGALPLLLEDPPLTLGAGTLAQRLLPDESDPLLRGTVLQQALRAAIERLRPAGNVSAIDRSWWPYLICIGEYEAGQSRAELQRELALSASTYSRAKRQGLERIATSLPQIVAQLTVAPAALVCQRLPRTPDFVGRHEEQSYYAWRLQAEGRAYIWGLPGSGKTVLAAELAAEGHRFGMRVVWHTCAAGRDATLAGIVRGLAQSLAGSPEDPLWQRARQAGAGEEALALLEELGERLAQQPTLVVLDDVHRADAAETAALFALLEDLMARKRVRLLLVGRTRPAAGDWPALPGLCEEEAHLLWGGEALLPADQWQALYTAVGGLPQPLRLAAAAYRRAGDLARPSDWSAAVEDWARDALWGQLDPAQRRALAVVCHIESRALPVSPDAVCGALGVDRSALESLRGYGLLAADEAARVLPVLRVGALQELRADAELRVAIEDLAEAGRLAPSAPCDAAPALATAAGSTMSEPPVMATAAPPPPGLELLARVRRALLHSAAYLQSRRDDEARVLLRELALLQSMLPDPGGPRAGRRGRRSPAGRSRGLALQRG